MSASSHRVEDFLPLSEEEFTALDIHQRCKKIFSVTQINQALYSMEKKGELQQRQIKNAKPLWTRKTKTLGQPHQSPAPSPHPPILAPSTSFSPSSSSSSSGSSFPLSPSDVSSPLAPLINEEDLTDSVVEETLRFYLRSHGRRWITARELIKQIFIQNSRFWLDVKQVNRCLYNLEEKKIVQKQQLMNIKGGTKGSVLWQTCELEPTSVEEVEALLLRINDDLKQETARRVLQVDLLKEQFKDSIDSVQLESQSNEHHVPISESSSSSSNSQISAYRMKCQLQVIALPPESVVENPLLNVCSKPCMDSNMAKIHAHHQLLQSICQSRVLTDKYKKLARERYALAYSRGREWKVGDFYPFQEDEFLELKGMDPSEYDKGQRKWKGFDKMFADHTLRTLCAFVNTALLQKRPVAHPRIVFGVTDHFCITGVFQGTFNVQPDQAQVTLRSIEDKLQQDLRRKIAAHVDNRGGMADNLQAAIRVIAQPLSVSHLDWLPTEGSLLITVELNLEHDEMEILQPTLYGKKPKPHAASTIESKAPEAQPYLELFVRTKVPERIVLKELTEAQRKKLFPFGIPPELKIQLAKSDPATTGTQQ